MNASLLTSEEISEFNLREVPQYKARSEKILQKICNSYFRPLRYFSLGITDDYAEASDIAIESLTKLWESKWQFSNETQIRMVLFTTARNACFNILKQRKRRRNNLNAWKHSLLENENTVAGGLEEMQIIEMIANMIEIMPGKTGRILNLCFYEELRNRDVANQLNTSVNTVAQLKKKGLDKLRKFFNRN